MEGGGWGMFEGEEVAFRGGCWSKREGFDFGDGEVANSSPNNGGGGRRTALVFDMGLGL